MGGMILEVECVKRVCPPTCPANETKNREDCRCTTSAKIIAHVVLVAKWDGIRRYRAWFKPSRTNSGPPKIFNKERFNEQGCFEVANINIPDGIYLQMRAKAAAIILSGSAAGS